MREEVWKKKTAGKIQVMMRGGGQLEEEDSK